MTRLLILSLGVLFGLSGCLPQVAQAPPQAAVVPIASQMVISPPSVKSQEAAQAIEKSAKDTELKAKEVALAAYERLVESTRQGKVSQANYSKAQKIYDGVVSALHAYSVLSPLGGRPADDARLAVAKALAEFLTQVQQLKVF